MKKINPVLSLLLFSVIGLTPVQAADQPYISVGAAKTRKSVLALVPTLGNPEVSQQLNRMLGFMDLFSFMDPKAFLEPAGSGIAPGTFQFPAWKQIGAEFLIKSRVIQESGRFVLEGYLYEVAGARNLLAKRYVLASGDLRSVTRLFANDIVQTLTGKPGLFNTKIVMSCERPKGRKELYLMDFDGSNVRQITNHRSISMGPAWNPAGTKIAYSVFMKNRKNIKNIDLYEFDLNASTTRMLSNRTGINSGANYSPDGTKIALTMSFLNKNPEIFVFRTDNSSVERLTSSAGEDVDPAWSPDGRQIAFVSSRSGQPMVYTMNADGSNVKRVTYAGRYNATPNWSPDGKHLVFAGWIDGRFDLFVMKPDGSAIDRLTKNVGNNEDPSYSPDGSMIIFSSNRTGSKNIYVANASDGTGVKRLTFGMGDCTSPRWSSQ
jgi:TolB protein